MAIIQARSHRKPTGGQYRSILPRRRHMTGRLPSMTKLGGDRRKQVQTKGGGMKLRALNIEIANLLDPKTKKAGKAKISNVIENPANRYFVRRNILTKGTVIVTDKGKARVTSRPGQDGIVNAVLIG
jgi:small subunit ribosomal protein S8e